MKLDAPHGAILVKHSLFIRVESGTLTGTPALVSRRHSLAARLFTFGHGFLSLLDIQKDRCHAPRGLMDRHRSLEVRFAPPRLSRPRLRAS